MRPLALHQTYAQPLQDPARPLAVKGGSQHRGFDATTIVQPLQASKRPQQAPIQPLRAIADPLTHTLNPTTTMRTLQAPVRSLTALDDRQTQDINVATITQPLQPSARPLQAPVRPLTAPDDRQTRDIDVAAIVQPPPPSARLLQAPERSLATIDGPQNRDPNPATLARPLQTLFGPSSATGARPLATKDPQLKLTIPGAVLAPITQPWLPNRRVYWSHGSRRYSTTPCSCSTNSCPLSVAQANYRSPGHPNPFPQHPGRPPDISYSRSNPSSTVLFWNDDYDIEDSPPTTAASSITRGMLLKCLCY